MAAVLPDRLLAEFQAALGDRYHLERELGRGGMGIVYLAREERLQRPVAIKLLPPVLASQSGLRERLLQEARTAAQLSHPHVVPIHSVDETGPFAYFVMAYVEGETLAERVGRRGPLPPVEVARLLREAAWALAYAHARGVVHRDVKPENILLDDATARTLLTDFGIAQAARDAGLAGEVVGTPEFMSPEQASGEPVDGRSDLYSLGVVGYYALTGTTPFRGASVGELLARQIAQRPALLAEAAPRVPRRLAAIVERCLEKDPAARHPSGEALVEALDAALPAHRHPLAIRTFLSEGQRRTAFRLLYVLLGALVLVPAGLWWLLAAGFRGRPPAAAREAVLAVAALIAAFAVVAPLARVVERVRRLRGAGISRQRLLEALVVEVEERREELAFLYGVGGGRKDRTARRVVYGALTVAVAAGAGAFFVRYPAIVGLFVVFGAGCATALLGAIVAGELGGRRSSAREERRLRFWRGPVGKLLFRLARVDPL